MHNTFRKVPYLTPLCVLLVSAVPQFDINLDLPPEKRWVEVSTQYKQAVINSLNDLVPEINGWTNKKDWIDTEPIDAEYEKELQGIVDACDDPSVSLLRLKWLNMMYETDSPLRHGCSDVLWARPDGTVVHGRNLDYPLGKHGAFPKATLDYSANVYDVTFHKNGQPLMKATAFPGEIGVHTGMRLPTDGVGGWGFAQNTRTPNDKWSNLKALEQGGEIFPLGVRRIMEKAPKFGDAVKLLYSTKWAAPQYFTVSGAGSLEGGVLTIDRLGEHSSANIRHLGGANDAWYMVQTNDDADGVAKDDRRETANNLLAGSTQDITLAETNMHEFMHTQKLLNDDTLFTTVMVPASGYYSTHLPTEQPTIQDDVALIQKMQHGSLSLSQVSSRQRKSFLTSKRRSPKWVEELLKDEVSFLQTHLKLDL